MDTVNVELTFDEITLLIEVLAATDDSPARFLEVGTTSNDKLLARFKAIDKAHLDMLQAASVDGWNLPI